MTWTKLSDDFSDDCWTLSDSAFRLHVEGLCWSNRKLLDLEVPAEDVRRFAKHPEAVAELVACGWWTEDGDKYVIRHHATYQRPRDAVLAQQAANKANGRKGGRPPKPAREQAAKPSETQSVGDSPGEARTERDRTGQDWQGHEVPPGPKLVAADSWVECPDCHWVLGSTGCQANCGARAAS